MAPIDIVEAEAEVATREEAVIVAEARSARPRTPCGRSSSIRRRRTSGPWARADRRPGVRTPGHRLGCGGANGARAPDRPASRRRRTCDNERRQPGVLPEPDCCPSSTSRSTTGRRAWAARSTSVRGEGFPSRFIGEAARGFGSVLRRRVHRDFPTWTSGPYFAYPLGKSTADANLRAARLEQNAGAAAAQEPRAPGRRPRCATSARKSTRTRSGWTRRARPRCWPSGGSRPSRRSSACGMSTSFLVFQAQRDLATGPGPTSSGPSWISTSRWSTSRRSRRSAVTGSRGITISSGGGALASVRGLRRSLRGCGSGKGSLLHSGPCRRSRSIIITRNEAAQHRRRAGLGRLGRRDCSSSTPRAPTTRWPSRALHRSRRHDRGLARLRRPEEPRGGDSPATTGSCRSTPTSG